MTCVDEETLEESYVEVLGPPCDSPPMKKEKKNKKINIHRERKGGIGGKGVDIQNATDVCFNRRYGIFF